MRYNFGALTNGILAGLVSVTAGCNAFEPWAAFAVGIIGSFIYIAAARMMDKLKIDDPVVSSQLLQTGLGLLSS